MNFSSQNIVCYVIVILKIEEISTSTPDSVWYLENHQMKKIIPFYDKLHGWNLVRVIIFLKKGEKALIKAENDAINTLIDTIGIIE